MIFTPKPIVPHYRSWRRRSGAGVALAIDGITEVSTPFKHVRFRYEPFVDGSCDIGPRDVEAASAAEAAWVIQATLNDHTARPQWAYPGGDGHVYVLDTPIYPSFEAGVAANAAPQFLAPNTGVSVEDAGFTEENELRYRCSSGGTYLYRRLDTRRKAAFKAAETRRANIREAERKVQELALLARGLMGYYTHCVRETCEFTVCISRGISSDNIVHTDGMLRKNTIPALKQCRMLQPCALPKAGFQQLLDAKGWMYIDDTAFINRWRRQLKADIARVTKETEDRHGNG